MTRATFPSRCAVAVACGEHLVSQVYPAAVPIEVFIDDAVFLVAEELKRRGADGPDPGGYELRRVNGTRLDPARTLDELGIGDGSTLVLAAAESGDPFEPHYESLSTGLANVARRLFPPVTERTAAQTALVILGLVATAVIVLAWHERAATDSLAPAAVAGSYGCLLAVGALWVRSWWPQRRELLCGFGWLAVAPLAFAAAATAPGVPGSAHLFIGAVAACVLVIVATILIRGGIAFGAAAAALCALTSVTAAIRMWRPVPGPILGIGILAGLLFLLTAAPTVALWSARLRPPHFGSVTGRDLFRRSDGMPLDAVAPVESGEEQPDPEDQPDSDRTPRGAAIVASALRGNAVLTGLCVAAACALPAAIWSAVGPDQSQPAAAAGLGGMVVLVFISRARAFADRRQAVALVCGAAAGFCVGVVREVCNHTGSAALLWGSVVLFAFGALGLAAALLVPVTAFTPLVRIVAEWLELIATAVALPLAAWIDGLFSWVRMR